MTGLALPAASTSRILSIKQFPSTTSRTLAQFHHFDILRFTPGCEHGLGLGGQGINADNQFDRGNFGSNFEEIGDPFHGHKDDCEMGVVDANPGGELG